MKHESVTDQLEEQEAFNDLAKEIRADGQKDVDAEVRSRPLRLPHGG